jgi:hypothetical protein
MPSLRRARPLPIPGAELARLRETLHPEYGSTLHESAVAGETERSGEIERILIVRVPRDDPDMVNDVEQCIEYLHPGELQDATSCLLVGHRHTLQFPTQPLKDLMAVRIQFDRRQCHLLRGQLKPGEHRLFKAPEDPRRRVRLALRLARARVADVVEEDLLAAARELGPKAATPAYREARSVYLIADKDDVRMDAELFFQDVQARWGEESERRRLAEEIVQKESARRIQEEAARQKALAAVRDLRPRVALAPLRSRAPAPHWEAAPDQAWDPGAADPRSDYLAAAGRSSNLGAADPRAAMYAQLDAILGIPPSVHPAPHPAPRPSPADASAGLALPTPQHPDPEGTVAPFQPAAPAPAPLPPALVQLKAVLEASGFDVLVRPKGTTGIDLAAERAAGFPNRLIATCPERLDPAGAEAAIAAARQLQVDLALVVCEQADAEAKKRLVATRVRWLDPAALADLHL